MARCGLPDAEGALIPPLPPNWPRGLARVDDRRGQMGSSWEHRSGSPSRHLPWRDGPSLTVRNRFNRWAKAGVRVFAALAHRSPEDRPTACRSWRPPSSAPPGRQRRQRGGGPRPRGFPWATKHEDQRDGPCAGAAGAHRPLAGTGFGQGGGGKAARPPSVPRRRDRGSDARAVLALIAAGEGTSPPPPTKRSNAPQIPPFPARAT